jgi:hypothetical protein
MLVAVQLSVLGLYLPPLFVGPQCSATQPYPPQTIISLPVQTVLCRPRLEGALVVLVAVQLSVSGSYLPPVVSPPFQTIISLPVHTAALAPVGALVVLVAVQLSVLTLYLPPVLK